MHDIGKRFLWVSAYVTMETWREAATLVMLASVGWLAGRKRLDRWAYGWFAFGMWNIGYYVWLKVLLDWPVSLLSLDTLFLIPLTWWGPVLVPTPGAQQSRVLIAAMVCVVAALAVVRMERGEAAQFTSARGEMVFPRRDLVHCHIRLAPQ